MSLKKYNKESNTATWSIDSTNFAYVKIRDLDEGVHYALRGMFVTPDHGYGEGAVLITDHFCVNIPNRYVDLIREMIADPEVVAQINAGGESWHYEKFMSKYNREGFKVIFD